MSLPKPSLPPEAPGLPGQVVVYISGPISGMPDGNRAAFEAAAQLIRDAGYRAINPHELHGTAKSWAEYLRFDLAVICLSVHLVVALDGWTMSKGAMLEVDVARHVGIPVFGGPDGMSRCLAAAARLADGLPVDSQI